MNATYMDFDDVTGEEIYRPCNIIRYFYEKGDPIPGVLIELLDGTKLSVCSQDVRGNA